MRERTMPSKEARGSEVSETAEDVLAVERPPMFGDKELEFSDSELVSFEKDRALRGKVTDADRALVDQFRAEQRGIEPFVLESGKDGVFIDIKGRAVGEGGMDAHGNVLDAIAVAKGRDVAKLDRVDFAGEQQLIYKAGTGTEVTYMADARAGTRAEVITAIKKDQARVGGNPKKVSLEYSEQPITENSAPVGGPVDITKLVTRKMSQVHRLLRDDLMSDKKLMERLKEQDPATHKRLNEIDRGEGAERHQLRMS